MKPGHYAAGVVLAAGALLAVGARWRRARGDPAQAAGMRVMLDCTWESGPGGTARYVRSIQAALLNDPRLEVVCVGAPRLPGGPRLVRLPLNGALHLSWSQVGLPVLAWWSRADLIHATMTAPVYAPCPVVLTLHDALDFMPGLRPSWVWSGYMRTVGAIAARRAESVLTGTQASASEIARYYQIAPERVRVTPYGSTLPDARGVGGVSPASAQANIPPPGRIPNGAAIPYALMVGVADRRKDIATGVRAVGLVRDGGVEVEAVVVGSVPSEYAGTDWVRVVERVTDNELASLYEGALAVLVPSRHEGYGLPVVEALAFGTPVVASDLPALREVGGGATRYAPAGDAAAFADALAAIAAAPDDARRIVSETASGAHALTWDGTARATVAVYTELAGCGR